MTKSELIKNPFDEYSMSRIMRRCGQLKIPFDRVLDSPYFKTGKRKVPKSDIQYSDGLKNTTGWGSSSRQITDEDTVPFTYEDIIIYLGLDKSEDYVMTMPDEVAEPSEYPEGSIKQVSIEVYERNPQARKKCIEHYGSTCSVCEFNFEKYYGEIGKGFIHVHHLKPISKSKGKYSLDPISDLRPVCPNCHSMLHTAKPPRKIEDFKRLIKK